DQLAHIENYGKRGDRTDQLIDRLDSTEIQASIREADIILITIGANDIMQVVKENITNLTYEQFTEARTKYESRLQSLFNKIKALNGKAEIRSEEHTSELQSRFDLVCRLLLEKKKYIHTYV